MTDSIVLQPELNSTRCSPLRDPQDVYSPFQWLINASPSSEAFAHDYFDQITGEIPRGLPTNATDNPKRHMRSSAPSGQYPFPPVGLAAIFDRYPPVHPFPPKDMLLGSFISDDLPPVPDIIKGISSSVLLSSLPHNATAMDPMGPNVDSEDALSVGSSSGTSDAGCDSMSLEGMESNAALPKTKEKEKVMWGMDAAEYRALSAKDRKRLRNRISAKAFRAKRKTHITELETNFNKNAEVLERATKQVAALKKEIRHLKTRLRKYEERL